MRSKIFLKLLVAIEKSFAKDFVWAARVLGLLAKLLLSNKMYFWGTKIYVMKYLKIMKFLRDTIQVWTTAL